MAKFLKIPQYFGQAAEILYYNASCQYDNLEYYRHVKKIDGHQCIVFDGKTDYLDIKYDNSTGWFPQVGSTFFMKFIIPENSPLYSKSFGIFGTGSNTEIQKKDFWGLYVAKDNTTGLHSFGLTVSNLVQIEDIRFRGTSFSPLVFPPNVVNTIALTQTSNSAQLYANGNLIGTITIPFTPETRDIYTDLYIGRYGNTTEYNGMEMYLLEAGCWERPIDSRDIIDLRDNTLVTNKGSSKTAKRIKIDSGQIYYDGYIHSIDSTSMYIDGIGKETIYLLITETLVTEREDPDLLDNSTNTYNLGKPGMHRIKYTYAYGVNVDTANLPEGTKALKYLEFEDGVKTFSLLDNTVNDVIEDNSTSTDSYSTAGGKKLQTSGSVSDTTDLLSKYFHEALGNFISNGLSVSITDKDYSTYQISVGTGVYYLNGNRYELDSNITLEVAKNSSMADAVNESFAIETGVPILFSQQPVAARYIENGILKSGITRALAPKKVTKTVNVTRMDPFGEDIVDLSAIKVLKVTKFNSPIEYTPCETIDGEGDYYFYNGRIKWSPLAKNYPNIGGVDSYIVEYTKLVACNEGRNQDFIVIKGDKYIDESIEFKGKNITHVTRFNIGAIVEATVTTSNGTKIQLSSGYFTVKDNTFVMSSDLSGMLKNGDTINLTYSYSTDTTINPMWYIVFLENGSDPIETSTNGIMDYKYYLTDIYTVAIDADNSFRLYRGTPGYLGNAVKAAIPDTSLPIADILIDPDNADYCSISPYGIYRLQVNDMRNLLKKVNTIENNIAMNELEKAGESKTNIDNLKGMFVDSLANYNKVNTLLFDAYINTVTGKLNSGYDTTVTTLEFSDLDNVTIGEERYFPSKIKSTSVIDSQKSYTGEDTINKIAQAVNGPQVEVFNDYSYNPEELNNVVKNVISSIRLCPYTLIPGNSDVSVFNNTFSNDTGMGDRQNLIKSALDKFSIFFEGNGVNTTLRGKRIVLVGKGFNANETFISVQINDKFVDPMNYEALNVTSTDIGNTISIMDTQVKGFGNFIQTSNKTIKIPKLTFASGWKINPLTNITANAFGEFVVAINIPSNMKVLTGTQEIKIMRGVSNEDWIAVKANFNGLVDSLKSVVNTGSRGNIAFFDSLKHSVNTVPAIIQPISSVTATITGLNIFLPYIDYSSSITIDLCELDGSNIKKILYRHYIKTKSDFSNIDKDKYSITFAYPINLVNSKKYGIAISTENPSITCKVTEVGQPSKDTEDKNVVVSKLKSYYTITGKVSDGVFNTNNDGRKGICYELLAVDNTKIPKNSQGYLEYSILANSITFDEEQNMFSISCDIDPTTGYDRKVSIEYSTDNPNTSNEAKTWTKITPYTLVTPKEKFKYLTIRFVLSSANSNYLPSIHQFPTVNTFKMKDTSAYYSTYFKSSIEDMSGDTDVNIYVNTEHRPGSDYTIYVSPDLGINWVPCTASVVRTNANTADLILREEKHRYECRLLPPIIIEHEFIPFKSGERIGDSGFEGGTIVEYLVALLDTNGSDLSPNEVYNVNTEGHQIIYKVTVPTEAEAYKIKLRIKMDSNALGFRVYRSINESGIYSQIYNSVVKGTVGALQDNISLDYQIPVIGVTEFPRSGIVRINNELIQYFDKDTDYIRDVRRAFYNTTRGPINTGDIVELLDFCREQESILKGTMPKIFSENSYFEFLDDKYTYIDSIENRVAAGSDQRQLNQTVSYPKYIGIKIEFNNAENTSNSSSIYNMICNVEKP